MYSNIAKKSGYNIFFNEKMIELQDTISQNSKRISEAARLWGILADEEKAVYNQKAEEYSKQQGNPAVLTPQKSVGNKNDSAAPCLASNIEYKPLSGYNIFMKTMFPILKQEGLEGKNMLKEIGLRWVKLTDEEKVVYRKMADEENVKRGCGTISKSNYLLNTNTKKCKNMKCSDSDDSDRSRDNYSDSE
jgi:hypothetical protein